MTSVALLQCIDKGLITLDEPLTKIAPEFENIDILTGASDSGFAFEQSKTAITARHLLSHTSGLGYKFLHPLLMKWSASQNQGKPPMYGVPERHVMPLVFEPGTGWLYGCSMDWAGVVVSRLHGGMTLEDYMVENIWAKLGLSGPFPRFNIMNHPEYESRAMHGVQRTKDGGLEPCEKWPFDNPVGQDGGSGLSCTAKDFVAVLADLVSESPKLLKPETISEMFTPQLPPDSASTQMLLQLRPAWEIVAGPIAANAVNHGLGGVLCTGSVPEVGQPGGTLGWGGASNIVWWANREQGVAGFFATQQLPFGNPTVTKLVNAWKEDFWSGFSAKNDS